MKKFLLPFLFCLVFLLHSAIGQDEQEVDPVQTTEQTQEPAASQQVILYTMTVVGVILIGVSIRRSKLFRKK